MLFTFMENMGSGRSSNDAHAAVGMTIRVILITNIEKEKFYGLEDLRLFNKTL